MKAVLINDEEVTVAGMPEDLVKKLSFRRKPGKQFPSAYFARGTELEGEIALTLVRNGQATPADEECRVKCGMSADQIDKASRTNAAALAGIRGERDMAMFLAGAINGYAAGSTDADPKYVPGPNWDAWQAAENEVAQEQNSDL